MTAPMPNIDLAPKDWLELTRILEKHLPDMEVWVFGSRARWTAQPYSDLDLAIISEAPLSLAKIAELREALDESDLSMKVDLVDWAATSETFKNLIAEQKVVLRAGRK